jgi:hypothetical protein
MTEKTLLTRSHSGTSGSGAWVLLFTHSEHETFIFHVMKNSKTVNMVNSTVYQGQKNDLGHGKD